MLIFDALRSLFLTLAGIFHKIRNIALEIWFVGDRIAPFFYELRDRFNDAAFEMLQLSLWAGGIESQVKDFLTWDKILDKLFLTFPILKFSSRDFLDWIWDLLVVKAEQFLEDRLDWVWRVGGKVLDKLW